MREVSLSTQLLRCIVSLASYSRSSAESSITLAPMFVVSVQTRSNGSSPVLESLDQEELVGRVRSVVACPHKHCVSCKQHKEDSGVVHLVLLEGNMILSLRSEPHICLHFIFFIFSNDFSFPIS